MAIVCNSYFRTMQAIASNWLSVLPLRKSKCINIVNLQSVAGQMLLLGVWSCLLQRGFSLSSERTCQKLYEGLTSFKLGLSCLLTSSFKIQNLNWIQISRRPAVFFSRRLAMPYYASDALAETFSLPVQWPIVFFWLQCDIVVIVAFSRLSLQHFHELCSSRRSFVRATNCTVGHLGRETPLSHENHIHVKNWLPLELPSGWTQASGPIRFL